MLAVRPCGLSGFKSAVGQMGKLIAAALADIREALRLRAVWIALASEDIGDQHKRTTLGPFWLLLNYLIFIGTFIVVFGGPAGGGLFAAYAATGLFVWFYIMDILGQSAALFVREESFIKGTVLPLTTYVLRLTMQSVIRSGYALIGCAAILLLVQVPITITWSWSIVALGIVILATPPTILILALIGAFFPDMQFIMQNAVRVGMFLTPTFWGFDEVLGWRGVLYHWNPFTYFLEIFRQPIVFDTVPVFAMGFCLVVVILLWAIAVPLLGLFRKQIAFVI